MPSGGPASIVAVVASVAVMMFAAEPISRFVEERRSLKVLALSFLLLIGVMLVAEGFDRDTVIRIERLLHLAEYKRRQAPPGVKLGTRNFGRDRRYPITHAFRTA